MKEGYIKKEQRKRILLLCDDLRLHSGVGNVAKEMVTNTAHHYNWFNLGGAINHPEVGKRFDLSEAIKDESGVEDAEVMVQPNNGYGSPEQIRRLLKEFKFDAIFLITDPRYFSWLFQIENEIRKDIPIIYLNIWDDYPAPMYNKAFYESCDALFGISKQTVNINKLTLGEKSKDKVIKYVPHGLNEQVFIPITKENSDYEEYIKFKESVFQNEDIEFVLFFNSRNIRRKQIPDALLAWKYFYDKLPKEKQSKVKFLLHTEIVSEHGTDLMAVKDYLFGEDDKSIGFSTSKLDRKQLNYLYNLADAQILLTSNEGWGLSLTEALLSGTPIIANTTGGMQDQMRFVDEEGNWFTPSADVPSNHTGKYKSHGKWAFPCYPTSRNLVGSPTTPYIWDDHCSPEDASAHIKTLYDMSSEERVALGQSGREWAMSDEAGFTAKKMGGRIIEGVDELFSTWKPRKSYEFINVNDVKLPTVPHKLLY
jgi:glycosyltransferase involved in cell wall biosynthesis|tara:strand:+ start:415 stop:1854 length:1440 start_codon:yes stop_codon:yes gene_type:complete